jgi:YD repeat-containing protein
MPYCIVRADRSCVTASQTQSATESITQKFRSRSHNAVARVYDDAGNVIETQDRAGDRSVKSAIDFELDAIR